MIDQYHRQIDYMRISITDRCNLRCQYCMPDGIESISMQEILTYEEILQVVRQAVKLGITKYKITGGEPLVRKGCENLCRMIKEIPGVEWLSITTNGLLLEEKLPALKAAGVDGINVSLDTTDPLLYRSITGFDGCEKAMSAIFAAVEMGFRVKINAVSADFAACAFENSRNLCELARNHRLDVRFIELMPIGYGKKYPGLSHEDLLLKLQKEYPGMEVDSSFHGAGPAAYYRIPGFAGSIGFISAIHGKFCGSCNRVRLTSTGFLKPCLCYDKGVDLREIVRGGQERLLFARMRECIFDKPEAHCFEDAEMITEKKDMVSIGG